MATARASCVDPLNLHKGEDYTSDLKHVSSSILSKHPRLALSSQDRLCRKCRRHLKREDDLKPVSKEVNNGFGARKENKMPSHPLLSLKSAENNVRFNFYYDGEESDSETKAKSQEDPKEDELNDSNQDLDDLGIDFEITEDQYIIFCDKVRADLDDLDVTENVTLDEEGHPVNLEEYSDVEQTYDDEREEGEDDKTLEDEGEGDSQEQANEEDEKVFPQKWKEFHHNGDDSKDYDPSKSDSEDEVINTSDSEFEVPKAKRKKAPKLHKKKKLKVESIKQERLEYTKAKPIRCYDRMPTPDHDKLINSLPVKFISGNVSYQCPQCEFITKRRELLKYHYYRHVDVKPFACLLCEHRARDPSSLREHFLTHSKTTRYKCDICGYRALTLARLKRHSMRHDKQRTKNYQCIHCKRKFFCQRRMRIHVENTHGDKPRIFECKDCDFVADMPWKLFNHRLEHKQQIYHCDQCTFSTKTKSELRIHQDFHRGLRGFPCLVCKENFSSRQEAKDHLSVHGIRPFKCHLCEYACRTFPQLRKHLEAHEGKPTFKCPVCSYLTWDKPALMYHRKTSTTCRNHRPSRMYKCTECKRSFVKESSLKVHKKFHETRPLFKCVLCFKDYTTEVQLAKHTKLYHGNMVNPRLKLCCGVCGDWVVGRAAMAVHVRKAHGFKCTQCDLWFASKAEMTKHNSSHSKGPLACDLCDYDTRRLMDLNRHLQTHKENVMHYCEQCAYQNTDMTAIRRHNANFHREHTFVCNICNAGFTKERNLSRHKLRTHVNAEGKCEINCNICGKLYHYRAAHASHMLTVHGIKPSTSHTVKESTKKKVVPKVKSIKYTPEVEYTNKGRSGTMVKCPKCGKAYQYSSCLASHLRREHGHSHQDSTVFALKMKTKKCVSKTANGNDKDDDGDPTYDVKCSPKQQQSDVEQEHETFAKNENLSGTEVDSKMDDNCVGNLHVESPVRSRPKRIIKRKKFADEDEVFIISKKTNVSHSNSIKTEPPDNNTRKKQFVCHVCGRICYSFQSVLKHTQAVHGMHEYCKRKFVLNKNGNTSAIVHSEFSEEMESQDEGNFTYEGNDNQVCIKEEVEDEAFVPAESLVFTYGDIPPNHTYNVNGDLIINEAEIKQELDDDKDDIYQINSFE